MNRNMILKAYYGDIFFESLLQDKPADAVIILEGFPDSSNYKDLARYFYGRGFHVFMPKYKGTYQSNGEFLQTDIIEDLSKFLIKLNYGSLRSLWDNKQKTFHIKRKILLSSSFGGAISCGLAAYTKEFSQIILFAPVWDFSKHNSMGNEQELGHLTTFVKKAYRHLYRYQFNNIQKVLSKIKKINPSYYANELDIPILVFHSPDDDVVSIRHTHEMKRKLKNIKIIEHDLGHNLNMKLINLFHKDIENFILY